MVKRILIFSHAMELGGAERALLGLLENVDYSRYQVDLFLMRHSGELLDFIPRKVNLLPEISDYANMAIPIGQAIRNRKYAVVFGRLLAKMMAVIKIPMLGVHSENGIELEYSHKYTVSRMPTIGFGEYDLAISFLTPHYYVAQKVKARNKIAWVHTDYSMIKVDVKSELKMWNSYSHIVSISESVSERFLKVFPSLRKKIILVENIIPVRSIRKQALEFSVKTEMPNDGSIKILSIGRFCTAKNFDNVPDICRKIIQGGLNVKWYLIGFGSDERLIKNRIIESNVENEVIILGKKTNPYPYINACDIYIQPSRYEGNSIAVHEAQVLGKPVVITNYSTAFSQLVNGVDGIIVPMENNECASSLIDILKNEELQKSIIRNQINKDYSKAEGLQKIYDLFCER